MSGELNETLQKQKCDPDDNLSKLHQSTSLKFVYLEHLHYITQFLLK